MHPVPPAPHHCPRIRHRPRLRGPSPDAAPLPGARSGEGVAGSDATLPCVAPPLRPPSPALDLVRRRPDLAGGVSIEMDFSFFFFLRQLIVAGIGVLLPCFFIIFSTDK